MPENKRECALLLPAQQPLWYLKADDAREDRIERMEPNQRRQWSTVVSKNKFVRSLHFVASEQRQIYQINALTDLGTEAAVIGCAIGTSGF